MVLSGTATDEWENYYFEWLKENQDPQTGLWAKSCKFKAARFHYLAAAFHYIFNYEYAKREIPNAENLLVTCIDAYEQANAWIFLRTLGGRILILHICSFTFKDAVANSLTK